VYSSEFNRPKGDAMRRCAGSILLFAVLMTEGFAQESRPVEQQAEELGKLRYDLNNISDQIKKLATNDQVSAIATKLDMVGQNGEEANKLRADLKSIADRVQNLATAEQIGQLSATIKEVASTQQKDQSSAPVQHSLEQLNANVAVVRQSTSDIVGHLNNIESTVSSLSERIAKLEMSSGVTYAVKQPVLRSNVILGYELL